MRSDGKHIAKLKLEKNIRIHFFIDLCFWGGQSLEGPVCGKHLALHRCMELSEADHLI